MHFSKHYVLLGFTAWSSTRDPAQVFILLQTVYQAFDKIAKRRKVFKVETIGDSVSHPEPPAVHYISLLVAHILASSLTDTFSMSPLLDCLNHSLPMPSSWPALLVNVVSR